MLLGTIAMIDHRYDRPSLWLDCTSERGIEADTAFDFVPTYPKKEYNRLVDSVIIEFKDALLETAGAVSTVSVIDLGGEGVLVIWDTADCSAGGRS